MSCRTFSMSIALAVLAACATIPRYSSAIPIHDARGIRNLGAGPFPLDFLAIKAGTEDRVVLEYDVNIIGRRVERVMLKIPVVNLDKGGDAGVIDVFAFKGDGGIKASDFYAGERIAQVEAPDDKVIRVDVTEAVKAIVSAGQRFIGFRLSTEMADRYFLGDIVDLRDPTLRSQYDSGE